MTEEQQNTINKLASEIETMQVTLDNMKPHVQRVRDNMEKGYKNRSQAWVDSKDGELAYDRLDELTTGIEAFDIVDDNLETLSNHLRDAAREE